MDGSGTVDVSDFLRFSSAYGTHVGGVAAVPEPASLTLLASAACLLLFRVARSATAIFLIVVVH